MPSKPSTADPVTSLLPLRAQDYYILFVLIAGECHGYRMVKEIVDGLLSAAHRRQ